MPDPNELENLVNAETSRRNTDMVVSLVFGKPELFDELFALFLRNEEPVSRRAAWVVDTLDEKKPLLLPSHVHAIIAHLPGFTHDGMKRMALKMLTRHEIPGERTGTLVSLCFKFLVRKAESVAVKVYAMDILYRFSQTEPEIKRELADSIEWRILEETPGFINHGKKILKKLHKELRDLQR
jgi:hypothetical protein